MFLRQTLIALRARRTAYRIAVDFLFPSLRLTGNPPPIDSAAVEQRDRLDRARHDAELDIDRVRFFFKASLLIALIFALTVCVRILFS